MLEKPKPLVIYHGGCLDGFTSAWVAWRHLTSQGADPQFFPATFGGEQIPSVKDRDVYILDFSLPREQCLAISVTAKSLLILDHHKTAEEDLKGLRFAKFDMKRSGAGLAWDHFYPEDSRPWLIEYVEDRDLGKFSLPNSTTINSWVCACPQTFEDWDNLCADGSKKALLLGKAVEAYITRYVNEMSKQAQTINFAGHNVPIVNAPYLAISELLLRLAEGAVFSMGWFLRGDGKYQYSLRSKGEFDVEVLAKRFGGGGHQHSAGFVLDEPVHDSTTLVV
jgi:oligoribonuclease NrnB/cAMP/cGMP phosphodiesterase (DHH superfamily)